MLPLVLDLCAGTKSATAAARVRGWRVVTVDNDAAFAPDELADVRSWRWGRGRPLAVWGSPPCLEFTRHWLPWLNAKNPPPPDMTILTGCIRVILEEMPPYWIIENVRGAERFFAPLLGEPKIRLGPFCLWGNFPLPEKIGVAMRKESMTGEGGRAKSRRAAVPAAVSEVIFGAIEAEARLLGLL